MLRNGAEKCSCPHIECKRNGKCGECFKFHRGKTYCEKKLKEQSFERQRDRVRNRV